MTLRPSMATFTGLASVSFILEWKFMVWCMHSELMIAQRVVFLRLTGKCIPNWVNQLAGIGSMCIRVLPEALKTSVVRHNPHYQPYSSEKRRLRCTFSCLSPASVQQKSSLLIQSPLRGCLPPWV
ncbi:hypothetical protein GQ457_16G013890 [Hibiscus cannabinus]